MMSAQNPGELSDYVLNGKPVAEHMRDIGNESTTSDTMGRLEENMLLPKTNALTQIETQAYNADSCSKTYLEPGDGLDPDADLEPGSHGDNFVLGDCDQYFKVGVLKSLLEKGEYENTKAAMKQFVNDDKSCIQLLTLAQDILEIISAKINASPDADASQNNSNMSYSFLNVNPAEIQQLGTLATEASSTLSSITLNEGSSSMLDFSTGSSLEESSITVLHVSNNGLQLQEPGLDSSLHTEEVSFSRGHKRMLSNDKNNGVQPESAILSLATHLNPNIL